jgi:hypothetical protein
MNPRIQAILDASAQLEALHRRVQETVRTRDRGAAERERWRQACDEFHRRHRELFYPGGEAALDALKRRESTAIDAALDFLEADPRHFRSGYTKEEVWKLLRRAALADEHRARLEEVALCYLHRHVSREFWVMARVMSTVASGPFWERLAALERTAEEPRRSRAAYLLEFRDGPDAGARFRRTLCMERLMHRHGSKNPTS